MPSRSSLGCYPGLLWLVSQVAPFYEADGQSLKNNVEVVSVPFQELKRGCGHVDQRS